MVGVGVAEQGVRVCRMCSLLLHAQLGALAVLVCDVSEARLFGNWMVLRKPTRIFTPLLFWKGGSVPSAPTKSSDTVLTCIFTF